MKAAALAMLALVAAALGYGHMRDVEYRAYALGRETGYALGSLVQS